AVRRIASVERRHRRRKSRADFRLSPPLRECGRRERTSSDGARGNQRAPGQGDSTWRNPCYSYLKAWIGLARATLTACPTTVPTAIPSATAAATTNGIGVSGIRWSKLLSQSRISHQAIGQAMMLATITGRL